MEAWGRRGEGVWLEAEAAYRAASSRLAMCNHLLIQFIRARSRERQRGVEPHAVCGCLMQQSSQERLC